ncbi:protein of unknown function [Natronincola peptidivorans]|uniref:IrrE N-terminal-like domain-containing protein n=1 Tax=Natronincola peptidivorans TaxID=426128 RepID=A0A1I0E161_9FIRM|nr:ImmA/IrrE family metallo-endopeptidase [Natronincola peptidivorans]SET38458.1 protein of unknown function [Natronincola peptidivorans]
MKLYVNDVLQKYELKHPLDVRGLVNILGFDVKYVDTGGSDAYTIIVGGKKLILLNKNMMLKERINFTLAHELGHYFIPDHLEPLYKCNVNELISTKNLNNNDKEREADLFASELLMPTQFIKKSSDVNSLEDIINTARHYNVSIPAAAIKIIEHTEDVVCFVYCVKNIIKWFVASEDFNNYIKLKDIVRTSAPEHSSLNICKETYQRIINNRVPAYIWIDEVESDIFVEEEVVYYPEYETGYILIKADNLINYDEDLFY